MHLWEIALGFSISAISLVIWFLLFGPPTKVKEGQLWKGPKGSDFSNRPYRIVEVFYKFVYPHGELRKHVRFDIGYICEAKYILERWTFCGMSHDSDDLSGPLGGFA